MINDLFAWDCPNCVHDPSVEPHNVPADFRPSLGRGKAVIITSTEYCPVHLAEIDQMYADIGLKYKSEEEK